MSLLESGDCLLGKQANVLALTSTDECRLWYLACKKDILQLLYDCEFKESREGNQQLSN